MIPIHYEVHPTPRLPVVSIGLIEETCQCGAGLNSQSSHSWEVEGDVILLDCEACHREYRATPICRSCGSGKNTVQPHNGLCQDCEDNR